MADSARAYFDTVFGMAGEPARRAREFAGRLREDLRSGSEQLRSHGGRTAHDLARLIRAELDATLSRIGVATQADLDDLNLRLEHNEEQIRELRVRLAEAEAAAAVRRTEPSTGTEAPPAAPQTRGDDEGVA
ncbi:hypothetical protein [Glycomyces albidus]|jgi:hypothetical protein|uniref:Uncharacterized protein n=1 Tax=Glycomyces albidus TaxID=2656774 RepID=A0A6L5G821_9ACTN|nr:hypothetical protein [Glycomyces albidus]MQM25819.1 hypothetical protein [Glycomyces albidus]